MDNDDLKVGINPIILNEKGEILLGKRLKKVGSNTYGLPGGHLKTNETIEEAAIRETYEETGLIVEANDISVINVARTRDYIQFGVLVKKYIGTPLNKELDNCSELAFFNLENLPELFFGTKVNIDLFIKNKFYDKDINILKKEKDL